MRPIARCWSWLVLAVFCLVVSPSALQAQGDSDLQTDFDELFSIRRTIAAKIADEVGDELEIKHHSITGTIDPIAEQFNARSTESIEMTVETKRIRYLLHEGFNVDSVILHSGSEQLTIDWKSTLEAERLNEAVDRFINTYPYNDRNPVLTDEAVMEIKMPVQVVEIVLPRRAALGERLEIETHYSGSYRNMTHEMNRAGEAWFKAEDFWFPDVYGPISTFDVTLTIPQDWQAYTQGQLLRETVAEGRRTLEFSTKNRQGQMTLVAGPYTAYKTEIAGQQFALFTRQVPRESGRFDQWTAYAGRFISLFESVLGEFPQETFALLEHDLPEPGNAQHRLFPIDRGHIDHIAGLVVADPAFFSGDFVRDPVLGELLLAQWIGHKALSGHIIDTDEGNWLPGLRHYFLTLWKTEVEQGPDAAVPLRRIMLEELSYTLFWNNPVSLSEYRSELGDVDITGGDTQGAISRYDTVGRYKLALLIHTWRKWLGDAAFQQLIDRLMTDYAYEWTTYDMLVGLLYDGLMEQGLINDPDRDEWIRTYSRDWLSQKGLPDYALDGDPVFQRDEQNQTFNTKLSLSIESYSAGIVPPIHLMVYDGNTDEASLVYFDDLLEWEAGTVELSLATARIPEWVHFDPNYDHLRWLRHEEKAPSFEFLRFTGDTAVVSTQTTHDYFRTELQDVPIRVAPVDVARYIPEIAFAEDLKGKNVLILGVMRDWPLLQNVYSYPLGYMDPEGGVNEETGEVILPRGPREPIPGLVWDLGTNDAVFSTVRHPDNPQLVLGLAFAQDLPRLAQLIELVTLNPLASQVTLDLGAVTATERSFPKGHRLQFAGRVE